MLTDVLASSFMFVGKTMLKAIHKDVRLDSFSNELFSMFPKVKFTSIPEDIPKHSYTKKNHGMVSYKVRKNYIQFAVCLHSAAHEIAHMVEMNNFSRLVKDDWGFDNNWNANFFAAFARETRVRAIQSHLEPRHGFNNEFWFRESYLRIPFGRFTKPKEVDMWVYRMFMRTRNAWSKDRIFTEWVKRVDYIRNWQESN